MKRLTGIFLLFKIKIFENLSILQHKSKIKVIHVFDITNLNEKIILKFVSIENQDEKINFEKI